MLLHRCLIPLTIRLKKAEADLDDMHILDMATQAVIQQQRIRLADNKSDWVRPQGLLGSPEPEVFEHTKIK